MSPDPSNLSLAHAGEEDSDFVRQLSGRVFARFGDYDRTLPVWMCLPEIETILARIEDERVGFAMYGTKTLSPGTLDLLAIAVVPERQSQGVGRRLLQHCEEVARHRSTIDGFCEIEVTVAEDNEQARRLFEGSGYLIVPGESGCYPEGQVALTLRKSLA